MSTTEAGAWVRRTTAAARRLRPGSLLERGLPNLAEVLVGGLLLLAVGVAVYAPHILDGGFYYDDWANAADSHYPGGGGDFFDAVDLFADRTAYRPVLVLYVPLTHELLGQHYGWHLAWSMCLAVLMVTSLFVLLRVLGIERIHALLVAALVLVFPAADATRLWATASATSLSISLLLLGAIAALAALRSRGRRKPWLHGLSVVLYLLSVMTYELGAPVILLAGLMYIWRGERREALIRWAVDVVAVGLTLLLVTSQHAQDTLGLQAMVDHAELILEQGLSVLAGAALPFGTPRKETVLTLLALVAVAGALVAWLLPRGDTAQAELRRWLLMIVAGVLLSAAGWAVLIPADPYYSPLTAGLGNRSNVMAAFGIVLLVYSVAAVAGVLVFRGLPGWRGGAAGIAALAGVVIGWGYVDRTRDDIERWDMAYAEEQRILGLMRAELPDPPDHSVVYLFGHPAFYAPGVPVFAAEWDLRGALKLVYRDPTLEGYPQMSGGMACTATTVYPTGEGYGPAQGARYGRAFFVDAQNSTVLRVTDRRVCRKALERFKPGPFELTPG